MFWLLVVVMGILGALADIAVGQWSKTNAHGWWALGAVGYLVFMTGLGVILRVGMSQGGVTLTIAVVLVVLVNIAGLAMWDSFYARVPLTAIQWAGIVLALAAVACFESGRA